jgi:hypothetical protein
MAGFSRKTHIVRVSMDDPPTPTGQQPTSYIDVEVIDAISFRDVRGEEMVLDMAAASALPYLVDNTGGGHGATPDNATRRSHMKRITSPDDPTQQIDIEVIDVVAFRGKNGEEWILDMSGTADDPLIFDVTTGAGGTTATRRVHDEKISGDLTDPHPTSYLNVERSDSIAFRTVFGHEMIVVCPSNDDPLATSSPRASTAMTPQNYNPLDTSASAAVPPSPSQVGDKSVYLANVKGSNGFMTNAAKIQQGPFWWIRAISPGGQWVIVTIKAGAVSNSPTPPPFPVVSFDFSNDDPNAPVASLSGPPDEVTSTTTTPAGPPSFLYFVWNNAVPFPTIDTYGLSVFNAAGINIPYYAQFAAGINDVNNSGNEFTGIEHFGSFAAAEAFAASFNTANAGPPQNSWTSIYSPTALISGVSVPTVVFAAQLAFPPSDTGSATASLIGTYGIKIPKGAESFSVNVTNPGVATTGNITSTIHVDGYVNGSAPGDGTPSTPATDDVVDAFSTASGGTTYTVETEVLSDPDPRVHIVVSGGSTRSGGPAG